MWLCITGLALNEIIWPIIKAKDLSTVIMSQTRGVGPERSHCFDAVCANTSAIN